MALVDLVVKKPLKDSGVMRAREDSNPRRTDSKSDALSS